MTAKSMLLVLDMINDLVHEDGPNGKKGYGPEVARRNIIEHAATAIGKARAASIPIGYVRVGFSPDYRECPPGSRIFQGAKKAGLFKLGGWGTEVHPKLVPAPADFDIVKHRVSPFFATPLEVILHTLDIRTLYLFGVSTSGAVLSAAKDGHDRDYEIVVIEDCCCAANEAQHKAVIGQMNRLATIITSTDLDFGSAGA